MPTHPLQVGFIGTGTMGTMLVRALLRAGVTVPANIWAANRSRARLESIAAEFNGLHCADAASVAAASEILFLCVKPTDVGSLLQHIRPHLRSDQVCVFLTNVFSFRQIEARIPCRAAKLIPSVVQQAGRGVALVSYGSRIRKDDSTTIENLLATTGKLLVVREDDLRILADVASCGPALLAAAIEELCLQASRKTADISRSSLAEAAVETLGATAELLRCGLSPAQLIGQVAVPGGMTEAGLQALREYLPQMIAAVLEATQNAELKKRESVSLDSVR